MGPDWKSAVFCKIKHVEHFPTPKPEVSHSLSFSSETTTSSHSSLRAELTLSMATGKEHDRALQISKGTNRYSLKSGHFK